jgi:hypothetical protein
MSFRLFIYYCALCGGAGAFLGWGLGALLTHASSPVLRDGLIGLWLGLAVALCLGLLDALWNLSMSQVIPILARLFVVVLVGTLGGLFGGIVGGALFAFTGSKLDFIKVIGWTLTGLLIGASLGIYDLLSAVMKNQAIGGALRKIRNGVLGGTLGGLLGGILAVVLNGTFIGMFPGKVLTTESGRKSHELWSPSAYGFVVLGACIGLLIALAQVILKEAWLKVEQGFRKGRELILAKPEITIGRAESCDVGLFGDNQIEKVHARIQHHGQDHILIDAGSASGTYVNDQRVNGSRALRSGDLIRVGRCLLRFGERAKG